MESALLTLREGPFLPRRGAFRKEIAKDEVPACLWSRESPARSYRIVREIVCAASASLRKTRMTFSAGKPTFNFRVAAVALHEGRVLLNQTEGDSFWSLPGGRIREGESSASALHRELREEMNIEVSIERLIWIVENFFEYDDQRYHEIGLYYLTALPESMTRYVNELFYGKEGELKITFQWRCLKDLDGIELKPGFLTQSLRNIPENIEYVLHSDI